MVCADDMNGIISIGGGETKSRAGGRNSQIGPSAAVTPRPAAPPKPPAHPPPPSRAKSSVYMHCRRHPPRRSADSLENPKRSLGIGTRRRPRSMPIEGSKFKI